MGKKSRLSRSTTSAKAVILTLTAIFCVVAIFLYKALNVLLSVFPLDNPEALVFTLTHNVNGSQNIVWIILEPIIYVSVELSLLFLLLEFLGVIGLSVLLYKRTFPLDSNIKLANLLRKTYKPYAISVFSTGIIFIFLAILNFPSRAFVDAYGPVLLGWSKENILFDKDYIHPDSVHISFEKKRNLVFLFVESMEYNFQDSANGGNLPQNLIPEVTQLLKDNVSFVPGGTTVNGTGWTMGEVIAKTCGIPLLAPLDKNTYGDRNFLKNAVCLTDILKFNGYYIAIEQGTRIQFASRDHFLSTHGVSKENIFDLVHFEKKGAIPTDTLFFESIPDNILYSEAKELITSFSNRSEPWTLMLYTVDTHGPYGRLDTSCVDEKNKNLEKEFWYPIAISCASRQLNDFLNWAKAQPWYENTTFAIMGDHPAMIAPEVAGFSKDAIEHYWIFFLINSMIQKPEKTPLFTSFDLFPTILEAMGAKIEGRALGLGRSLFSNQETLIEKYGKDSLNKLINRKGDTYNRFWR